MLDKARAAGGIVLCTSASCNQFKSLVRAYGARALFNVHHYPRQHARNRETPTAAPAQGRVCQKG
jgi:hypothetical protein